jgi:hypothetical protein
MKNSICIKVVLLSVILSSLAFAQYPQMDFPLQVGNRWQYCEVPGHYSVSSVVRDTTMPNGFTYAQVQGEMFGGFYRQDSAKVFIYTPSSNTEKLVYDFSKKKGDTLFVLDNGRDSVIKTVYDAYPGFVFGRERYIMKFLLKHTSSSMYAIYYITDGIGFSSYNGEVLAYGLVGAIINGVQYGIIYDVENSKNTLPDKFQLSQNYPNPFNPSTTFSFNLPARSFVSLKVFDVIGREVATIANEELQAGNHIHQWDASGLRAGAYFYRLQAGTFVETKKLLLLR